jgi:hypothetical protein
LFDINRILSDDACECPEPLYWLLVYDRTPWDEYDGAAAMAAVPGEFDWSEGSNETSEAIAELEADLDLTVLSHDRHGDTLKVWI